MKTAWMNTALCTALLLAGIGSSAKESVNAPGKTNSRVSFKTEVGDCVSPAAQFDMDINNVRARLLTGGDMWWNFSEAKYEVPKGDGTTPPLTAIFAGAIWISGKDAGGNLKIAAQTYRQGGDDYWPGPLNNNGTTDRATCTKYDRFFNVLGVDISRAQAAYIQKGAQTTVADIPSGVLAWPAKGNQYLRDDASLIGETFDINENLAPFYDADGDGEYNPVLGDYPIIPVRGQVSEAYGDQMVFWVVNDNGNSHSETNGEAIGVQINCLAFAFQTTDDINNMTFYKYEITNKSPNALNQTFISQWSDPDLGCYDNDRVGCDTSRALGIIYNGTSPDPDCQGGFGYGAQLPLIGIDFFEGPLSDDSIPKELGLSSFVYFTNGATPSQSDPQTAQQFRNYQTCYWSDGTPFTTGGTGYNSGGANTCFIFPGNPSDPSAWSECQAGVSLQPGDRRMVQTSGPFTLRPGQPQYVTVGVIFIRPPGTGVGLCPNFATSIAAADDKAQALFDKGFQVTDGPAAPALQIREMSNEIIINLINTRDFNNYGESYDELSDDAVAYVASHPGSTVDQTYTFEGYKVYQVTGPTVSATDLNDPTKAILVAQADVKNGVTRIVNFERDQALGFTVPVLKADGSDGGIQSSFRFTTDVFATGDNNKLINHRTYYYTAVAYAHNNFVPYNQDNPDADNQQLIPYLQGGKNFKIYSATPHIADPRNEGTIINSEFGEGVEVLRIEGKGNGGNNLMLTDATIDKIMASGSYAFADTLAYQKKFDPIGFKVTDPIALKEADFELEFLDADTNPVGVTTGWVLHDLTNNVNIPSERNLDRPYEQQIATTSGSDRINYGFSIKLGTPAPIYTIPGDYLASTGSPDRYVYSPLESSIEYQNPIEQWLGFVRDQGLNSPTNWIRSGINEIDPNSTANPQTAALAGVYDDNWYYTGNTPDTYPFDRWTDRDEKFEKILNGTWAPYCLTPNYAKSNPTAPAPPYVYGPGFKWRSYSTSTPPQNNLDQLSSVDVIITPDKSKWSKCIVFETGEDEGINEGAALAPNGKAARKGQIRMHYSWDAMNNRYVDGSQGETPDTGRSWFPGYAINVETGERLNIAFGESSDQGDQNGRDMLWNPTSNLYSPVGNYPYFGGKHFIYVMSSKYDRCDSVQRTMLDAYTKIIGAPQTIDASMRPVYYNLMWTCIPYLASGYKFADDGNGNKYIPPAEVKVRLRVEKPYDRMETVSTGFADSLPRYRFSTKGLGATENVKAVAKTACDLMNVVPNPYLGYSAYETDQNSNKVKITNLPNICNITIYSLDGTIIRTLSRAIGIDPENNRRIEISDGAPVDQVSVDNSVEWDLKNDKGTPIASGIYLIYVDAPGICQKTLKWFGTIRPADTSNF